jgi:hypothetical protein
MRLDKRDLDAAVTSGIVDAKTAAALAQFFEQRQTQAGRPRFDVVHVLWYAGALIVIGAMGLFSTNAFSQFGGAALTAIAAVYAAIFAGGGHFLWHRRNLRIPGGLLITVAVTMAPLALRHSGRARLVDPWRARHLSRVLRLDQGQLALHGRGHRRRRRRRALLLPLPLPRLAHCRRALVHVDGPDAVDLRPLGQQPQLGRSRDRLALVRSRHARPRPGGST